MENNDCQQVKDLLSEIKNVVSENSEDNSLPGNVYYLNNENILCCERNSGNSRYPYSIDGMNLWINSNGYIEADDGSVMIFRKYESMEETSVDFWGGIQNGNNEWFPVSITGAAKQLYESKDVKRYTVFLKRCAYYICDTQDIVFWLKAAVTTKKQIILTSGAFNKTKENIPVYLTSFIELMLMEGSYEGIYGKMNKFGKFYSNGTFKIRKDYLKNRIAVVNTNVSCKDALKESTVAKSVFLGRSRGSISNALSLKEGRFSKTQHSVNTTDWPVVSNIIKFTLKPEACESISYLISFYDNEEVADKMLGEKISLSEINKDIEFQEKSELERLSSMDIKFGKMSISGINYNVFNNFLKNVQKQTDLCAFGKNYVGNMLGVRDVFQQLETALIWDNSTARNKIIFCLNHIMTSGRSPRQFTVASSENEKVCFDMNEYVDQGLWIINAVYKYLCYTNDYSILSEICSYYEIINNSVEKSEETGDVLDHILKITDYLVSNIDSRTNCLRILFGDWNDALNGLGRTKNEGEFGTGVSVMASLQLYQALYQISEILKNYNKYPKKYEEYIITRENIASGLEKYALQKDGDKTHILHGWGDKGAYNVGSLRDSDNKCRYSSTVNSFWCISDMIERNKGIKKAVMEAFEKLDSKYGIKTFEPYFPLSMEKEVGRIVKLTPGTLENSSTYIHATTFAIIALFKIGESEKAWDQIKKIIPITHDNIRLSSFVMSNSYFHNTEYEMDGESMLDWYTGSGTVLLRGIVENALGIQPDLNGFNIKFPDYVPSNDLTAEFKIKNCKVKLSYTNKKTKNRTCFVNNMECHGNDIYIPNEKLIDEIFIEIND